MNRALLVLGMCLASTVAFADCTPLTNANGDTKAYQCDIPAPSSGPVTCSIVNGLLICNGEIGQPVEDTKVVKPSNCGWYRGHYRCGK